MTTVAEIEAAHTVSFHAALAQAEGQARSTLAPALHGRLSDAVEMAAAGHCFQGDDGTWTVQSATDPRQTYTHVNGQCPCDDAHYNHPPQGLCKHRLSVYLTRRAVELMAQPTPDGLGSTASAPETRGTADTAPPASVAVHGVDPKFVVLIQNKPFVTFAGLLTLAHQRGLQGLTVCWTYNNNELSLAAATAVFPFGTFQEAGDASPTNVTKKVAPHFRRIACTRAAARALRLALGVEVCSVEELADEEGRP